LRGCEVIQVVVTAESIMCLGEDRTVHAFGKNSEAARAVSDVYWISATRSFALFRTGRGTLMLGESHHSGTAMVNSEPAPFLSAPEGDALRVTSAPPNQGNLKACVAVKQS
jgi:hypothetical protein